MIFNSEKFEVMRFWPAGKKPDWQYLAPDLNTIEEKSQDLGVTISSDLSFKIHISNTIAGANKVIGMILRSFKIRSKNLMVMSWKSLVQPKLDYCSQLWSPPDQGSIGDLESVMRSFTSKIKECEHLDYWGRLQHCIHKKGDVTGTN